MHLFPQKKSLYELFFQFFFATQPVRDSIVVVGPLWEVGRFLATREFNILYLNSDSDKGIEV